MPGQDIGVQKVQLEPFNLVMTLPVGVKVSLLDDGVHLDFNPEGRQIRQCTLELADTSSSSGFSHVTQLPNETTLYYNIEQFEGGSGGEEHILTGLLLTPSDSYTVQSHDQAEYPVKPDPRFCLKYLSSLEYTS